MLGRDCCRGEFRRVIAASSALPPCPLATRAIVVGETQLFAADMAVAAGAVIDAAEHVIVEGHFSKLPEKPSAILAQKGGLIMLSTAWVVS
jgi:hypothetical protein